MLITLINYVTMYLYKLVGITQTIGLPTVDLLYYLTNYY